MRYTPTTHLLALTADEAGGAAPADGLARFEALLEAPAELADTDLDLDAILTALANDPELTDEQVGECEASLLDLFDQVRAGDVDGIDPRDVATLTRIADACAALGALASERLEAAEAVDQQLADLEARVRSGDDGTDGDAAGDEPEAADPAAATSTDDGDSESGDAPAEPEAVAAAATTPTVGQAAARSAGRRRVTAQARRDRQDAIDPRVRIVSTDGGELSNLGELARVMSRGFEAAGANSGKRVLATIRANYPDDRFLGDSRSHNGELIDAVVAAGADPAAWTEARVAAGGWCAPSPIRYDQVVQAIASRPVAASLPDFGADRGGVQIPVSPTLSVIDTDGETNEDAAIRIWTEDDDIDALDPDGPRKPVQRIDCNTWEDFRLYAVTRRLRFGNMASRANPENTESWNRLILAAYARKADSQLLELLKTDAGTTGLVQPAPLLGAARDVAELVLRLATFMRSAERADPEARIRGWFPDWLIALMQADLIRAERDTVDVTVARAALTSIFANAGINPTFYIDSPLTGPSQILGKQSDGGLPAGWPCAVQFGLAFEGHFGYLNGGEIDLGVWRDRDLNEVNDYETFAEGFEGIYARRGPEALWVTQDVMANGTSSAAIDISSEDLCDDATSG